MPRTHSFDIDPADVDADGLAASQTPLAGGNLTLAGALISGGTFTEGSGHARQLSVASDGNDSGRTFTVTGTDADGTAITEAITGPNTTTVESSNYFKTVSSVAVDAATAGAITVGTVDELCTKTLFLNRCSDTGALVHYKLTGTMSLSAQVAVDDVRRTYTNQASVPWITTDTMSQSSIGRLEIGATVCRFLVNSYSSTAEAQIYVNEEAD